MKINFNDLNKQWLAIRDAAQPQIDRLFETSAFINGPAVKQFEEDFAKYVGSEYAVGVSTGTDALKLAARALQLKGKVGVIIPANTFIATILGVEEAYPDAEFVLVDHDEYFQIDVSLVEQQLVKRREDWDECLLIPVHLYGHCADMKSIMSLAEQFNCKVLEDASQSHGTLCEDGRRTGSIGHISAFSLYPGKNLGAAGDAGVVTTNDESLAKNVEMLRNYGSKKKYYYDFKGHNHRLDTMQAIIVKEKLKHLDKWNQSRNKVADYYNKNITNNKVITPKTAHYCKNHTYHIYCVSVENRSDFIDYLNKNNVQNGIHYPIPIEETTPYSYLGETYNNSKTRELCKKIVSLPMHPFMSEKEMEIVCKVINEWK